MALSDRVRRSNGASGRRLRGDWLACFYRRKFFPDLLAAMMRQLTYSPRTKEDGLREFQGRGWLLVGATYEPVNGLGEKARDAVIVRDYPLLRSDVETLIPNKAVPIALVKANVCRLLEPWLNEDGLKVLDHAVGEERHTGYVMLAKVTNKDT